MCSQSEPPNTPGSLAGAVAASSPFVAVSDDELPEVLPELLDPEPLALLPVEPVPELLPELEPDPLLLEPLLPEPVLPVLPPNAAAAAPAAALLPPPAAPCKPVKSGGV